MKTQAPMIPFIVPHTGQARILHRLSRFQVIACGRRFGKTELGKIMLVESAARGGVCWWLSPTYRMAAQVWRDLKHGLAPLKDVQISTVEKRVDFLQSGGSLEIRSTHTPDYLRGAGLDYAVLDEAAFMPPTIWSEVVRPMLLGRDGGAAFLSSPHGLNWFWELYRLGLDPEEPDWGAVCRTSYDNPLIDPAEIDAIRRSTPERVFAEEYLAQFISDAGQVFRGVREVATALLDAQPESGHRYVAGIDFARDHDYTAIVIIDADTQAMVALDRFNSVSWAMQRGRLKTLCDRWSPAVIWAEANSIGSVNIEALQAEGLPVRSFTTTRQSKAPLIDSLALAIEGRDVTLLPDEVLLHELVSYTLERMPGGGYRYTAPAGGHDDCVMALALAWYGVQYGGVSVSFV